MDTELNLLEKALTKRELEVAKHAQQGLSSKEIAEVLGISKRTIDFHFASIFRKCRASNRMKAILTLRKAGVL